MPPPNWIPGKSDVKNEDDNDDENNTAELHTPLAGMLPPEYKGKDVRSLFPEFRTGKVSSATCSQFD